MIRLNNDRSFFGMTVLVAMILSLPVIAVAGEAGVGNPLTGAWQAQSLSFAGDDGKVEDVSLQNQAPCNATITDKTLTLRMGSDITSEMTYTIDGTI